MELPRVVSANVVTTDGTTIDLGTIGSYSLDSSGNQHTLTIQVMEYSLLN